MSREDLHFRLRLPADLKLTIEAAAAVNGRSMTAEIVGRLRAEQITLRDQFAMAAMQTRLTSTNMARLDIRHEIAADAYAIADAMLAAREGGDT